MKKHFRRLDAVAAALLVGTVAGMAIANSPVYCPAGTATIGGQVYSFGDLWCQKNERCGVQVTRDDQGNVVSVVRVCLTGPGPIG